MKVKVRHMKKILRGIIKESVVYGNSDIRKRELR